MSRGLNLKVVNLHPMPNNWLPEWDRQLAGSINIRGIDGHVFSEVGQALTKSGNRLHRAPVPPGWGIACDHMEQFHWFCLVAKPGVVVAFICPLGVPPGTAVGLRSL